MRKTIKNISAFFLLFASMAIIAHMVIPHDHHLTELNSGLEDSCPVSHESRGHHSGIPIHCHAFNDLTSEKIVIKYFSENIRHYDTVINNYSDPLNSLFQPAHITFLEIREPIPDYHLLESYALRAPPSLI